MTCPKCGFNTKDTKDLCMSSIVNNILFDDYYQHSKKLIMQMLIVSKITLAQV